MAVKVRFQPPRPVKIIAPNAPGDVAHSFYDGLVSEALGIDTDDLIAVPLPAIGDRPSYMGRFEPRYIEFLGEG